ncbi:hypothetical protein QTP88_005968 [Uroleucon formosanum]
MEDSVKITKLCAENWLLWKFQMKVILNSLEVGSIISGDWTKPSLPIKKSSESETNKEAKIRWQKQTNQKSEASIHLLQQKFFRYSKEPTDDMLTHISKLVNLGRELSLAGEPVMDNMVMTKILMTLPNEYNHFYSAWDSISAERKTVNNLTSCLLIEESRMQQIKGEVSGPEKSRAFSAKFQNKSYGKKRQL